MEALQIRLLRQVSPTRKMHMLAQLNAAARLLALARESLAIPLGTVKSRLSLGIRVLRARVQYAERVEA